MKKVFKEIFNYFKESRQELLKVTWPTKKQTIEMTVVVLVVTLVVGIYLGGIDYLLTQGLTWLISK